MENSKIEWTHHTFNPWLGCTKVSDGCKHCYAEELMDKRYGKAKWGPTGKRIRTSAANWRKPYQWNKEAAKLGIRYRVFCASLADVFEDKPNQPEMDEWRRDLFRTIDETPNLDWLLLTKRPENVILFLRSALNEASFPSNVWIGTSVENQEQADKRIPELLKVPASVRFLSMEPLLGSVLLDNGMTSFLSCNKMSEADTGADADAECCGSFSVYGDHFHGIDWVIVGGESGHDARPMHPDWARSIRDQCVESGVPFLFKQWGEWAPGEDVESNRADWSGMYEDDRRDGGAQKHHWPDSPIRSVNVELGREPLPDHHCLADDTVVLRVGKKSAGRLLDGVEWNQFPQ